MSFTLRRAYPTRRPVRRQPPQRTSLTRPRTQAEREADDEARFADVVGEICGFDDGEPQPAAALLDQGRADEPDYDDPQPDVDDDPAFDDRGADQL